MEFLSKNDLRSLVPSVFSKAPSEGLSEKYVHIPTEDVLDDLETLGWKPVKAQQIKVRKSSKNTCKHFITLQNPDIQITGNDGDIVFPQVLLINSHDGKSSFQFRVGLFRLVCSNGLVISTEDFGSMKIRHIHYNFEELQNTINGIMEQLPLTVDSMNKMKRIKLDQDQLIEFAKKAVSTRFSEDKLKAITIDYKELLEPTRNEDADGSLWSTFNLLQEKVIHGMFEYNYGVKTRKVRKIKNFAQNQKVNQELFNMALEYVN